MIELGMNLKKKEVTPKLFVISMKGNAGKGNFLVTIVAVAFTLEDGIEQAKKQALTMTGQKANWSIDSYIDFTPEKLISLFNEFKNEPKNKNTTS